MYQGSTHIYIVYRDDYIAKCAGLGYDPEMLALRVLYGRGSVLYELVPRGVSAFEVVEGEGPPFLFARAFDHYDPRKFCPLRIFGPITYTSEQFF